LSGSTFRRSRRKFALAAEASSPRSVGGIAITPTWADRNNSRPRHGRKNLADQRNNAIRILSP
jgi:hypothetical protein